MFSRATNNNNAKTAAPAPAARRAEAPAPHAAAPARAPQRVASVLAADLVFEGTVHGEGELMVDGAIKGDINVGRLIIGEHAHIEGTIRCGAVEVRGRVVGNVEAQQVKLYETAYVEGDITHGQLSIDVGAYFQGRCQQFRAPAQPTAAVAAAHAPVVQPNFASDAYPASDAPAAQVIELDATHRQ